MTIPGEIETKIYLRGTYRPALVDPTPGRPCRTGLYLDGGTAGLACVHNDGGVETETLYVRHGELGKVVSGHLGLDLNGVEDLRRECIGTTGQQSRSAKHDRVRIRTYAYLSVVDSDNGTDHLGDDDHVSEVGLDGSGLLVDGALLLGL